MDLYVLKLEDGCYYVGLSADSENRYIEHCAGRGAAWTRLHPPLTAVGSYVLVQKNASSFDENAETKRLMARHGVDKVRGGTYTACSLSYAQVAAIREELLSAAGACYRCGKAGHFASSCKQTSTDRIPLGRARLAPFVRAPSRSQAPSRPQAPSRAQAPSQAQPDDEDDDERFYEDDEDDN